MYFGHIWTPNPSTSGQFTIAIAGHYAVALTPDIDEIISKTQGMSLVHIKNTIKGEGAEIAVTSGFVELVRNKGFSMFHLIPDDEYNTGLKQLEAEVLSGKLNCKNSGETLVWFKKK